MIPYDLVVLLKIVNELKTSELRLACEKAGHSVEEVLNILGTYEVDDED